MITKLKWHLRVSSQILTKRPTLKLLHGLDYTRHSPGILPYMDYIGMCHRIGHGF